MREKIIEYCTDRDWVSFCELQRHIGDDSEGDISISFPGNIVMWAGMSEEFASCVDKLIEEKILHTVPMELLSYVIDGGGLRLPVAKKPPKSGYKKPRWLPTGLRHCSHLKKSSKNPHLGL